MTPSEILSAVKDGPLPIPKILAPYDLGALEYVSAANLVLQMASEGTLEKIEAPVGNGTGVRWLYGVR